MPDNVYNLPSAKLPLYVPDNQQYGLTGFLMNRHPTNYKAGWVGDLGPAQQASSPVPAFSSPTNMVSVLSGSDLDSPSKTASGIDWAKVSNGLKSVIPFASNIADMGRKPPMPRQAGALPYINLQRTNNANERANIENEYRGQDAWADRSLDPNAAASYRQANVAGKLRAFGDSYARENNANVGIANQETEYNAGIEQKNIASRDDYFNNLNSRTMAIQRQQSENMSNAADKYVSIQNSQAQRDLDQQKWTEMSRLYDGNLGQRYQQWLAAHGGTDTLSKKAMGGSIQSNKPKSYRSMRRAF